MKIGKDGVISFHPNPHKTFYFLRDVWNRVSMPWAMHGG